jgi:hypothetical protein
MVKNKQQQQAMSSVSTIFTTEFHTGFTHMISLPLLGRAEPRSWRPPLHDLDLGAEGMKVDRQGQRKVDSRRSCHPCQSNGRRTKVQNLSLATFLVFVWWPEEDNENIDFIHT